MEEKVIIPSTAFCGYDLPTRYGSRGRATAELTDVSLRQKILELVETVFIYKFPNISRQEIEQMLGLSELKQTRVYREALSEGLQQGIEQGRRQGRRVGASGASTHAPARYDRS